MDQPRVSAGTVGRIEGAERAGRRGGAGVVGIESVVLEGSEGPLARE